MPGTFRLSIESLATPIGVALIATDAAGAVRALGWADLAARFERALRLQHGTFECRSASGGTTSAAARALRRYFDGDLQAIDAVPVATGGTPFQQAVWGALRSVPCGGTVTYTELAARIGRPAAVRAAGAANGANPICVVVPCHRVVGAGGALTGYGGGLERKAWLLRHERAAGAAG